MQNPTRPRHHREAVEVNQHEHPPAVRARHDCKQQSKSHHPTMPARMRKWKTQMPTKTMKKRVMRTQTAATKITTRKRNKMPRLPALRRHAPRVLRRQNRIKRTRKVEIQQQLVLQPDARGGDVDYSLMYDRCKSSVHMYRLVKVSTRYLAFNDI